ncbi:MAG: S-layer homology domain-containing protein [Sulfobacillus sp.]
MRLRQVITLVAGSALVAAGMALPMGSSAFAAGQTGGNQVSFRDMGQASWATEDVAQLAAQGIIKGVGNGLFAPNAPLTRDEALALIVRALGNGQSGTGVTLEFTDDANIPAWATHSMEVAVQMGVLANSGTLNPTAVATRQQVIVWLISAMGLNTQAQSTSSADLAAFTDASQIPAQDMGAMALAVQLGLIKGTSATTISPNGTITRAQMAAMLARGQRRYGAPPATTSSSLVVGTVSGVSIASGTSNGEATIGTVTVTEADGTIAIIPVASSSIVYENNQSASLSALNSGDQVAVAEDAAGNAILVAVENTTTTSGSQNANGEQEQQAVEGTVSAITSTSLTLTLQGNGDSSEGDGSQGQSVTGQTYGQTVTGQTYTYTLASDAAAIFHGLSIPLSQVTVGSQVNVHLNASGQASLIIVQKQQATISGTIIGLGEDQKILIQEADGTTVSVKTDHQATITDPSGNPLNVNQLAVGDVVTVSGTMGEEGLRATTIQVTTEVQGSTSSSTSTDN